MRIKKLFYPDNGITILVVNRKEYFSIASKNREWEIYLNGRIYKKLEDLNELSLLTQSKNLDEIPLQTATQLNELRYMDLTLNEIELK